MSPQFEKTTALTVHFPLDQLAAVAWIQYQPHSLSRPAAVRRLIELGLKGHE